MKFQFETSKLSNKHGGIRKLPYVFTEQGVAMLSSVLKTSIASNASVSIMRAFVAMRHYIGNNLSGNSVNHIGYRKSCKKCLYSS